MVLQGEDQMAIQSPSEGEEKDWVLILKTEKSGAPVVKKEYYNLKAAEEKKVFVW